MTDELSLAGAIINGRASAARAIALVLDGSWATRDPLNSDAATLLISTFYNLQSDARSIFRESMCVLLDEYAVGALRWSMDELGSALYVSREIKLASRFPHELRDILTRALESATQRTDVDAEGLLLKYLATDGLISRLDSWRAFYAERQRHAYSCFMGMAAINLESAIIWAQDVVTDAEQELILFHGLPALVRTPGGAQYVERALRFLLTREDGGAFQPFALAYARSITGDPVNQEVLLAALSSQHDLGTAPSVDSVIRTEGGRDPEVTELAIQWDKRRGPEAMPARIQDILAGRYDADAA